MQRGDKNLCPRFYPRNGRRALLLLEVCGLFLWLPKFCEQPFGAWVRVAVQSGCQGLFSALPGSLVIGWGTWRRHRVQWARKWELHAAGDISPGSLDLWWVTDHPPIWLSLSLEMQVKLPWPADISSEASPLSCVCVCMCMHTLSL